MKLSKSKWKVAKIGDATAEMKAGFSSGKFELNNGEIAHLRSMNITDECKFTWEGAKYITSAVFKANDSLKLSKGDVLFNNTNSTELVGKSCYISHDMECGFSNHMTRIRVNDAILNSFYLSIIFYGYFKNRVFESYCQKWVGQSGINRNILSNIEIPLPPLEEQKQIAALFQSIETAIEQVEGQEKNLLNLKNKLLCELCGETQQFGKVLKQSDFEKVKFEKIAICISERIEPQKTELTTYVGLEHLDPDNLVIARTGVPEDVIGTKLKIYKGDIIFGKRRAYQRKVAVSHFDGIASAHSMILRANEKHIEREFLPFFMQSDVFMNRAVQISEGSLSPTIKWKTLAAQEFSLPKKEKQKELTAVFKQFDVTRGQLKQQKTTLQNLKQKLLSEILG
jgi:restriction endonuclease S subunit